MTIPISIIAPWIAFAVISAIAGTFAAIFTSYPRDPTLRRWCLCFAIVYAALSMIHGSVKGWIVWT